jgi:hypothetical protein
MTSPQHGVARNPPARLGLKRLGAIATMHSGWPDAVLTSFPVQGLCSSSVPVPLLFSGSVFQPGRCRRGGRTLKSMQGGYRAPGSSVRSMVCEHTAEHRQHHPERTHAARLLPERLQTCALERLCTSAVHQ